MFGRNPNAKPMTHEPCSQCTHELCRRIKHERMYGGPLSQTTKARREELDAEITQLKVENLYLRAALAL